MMFLQGSEYTSTVYSYIYAIHLQSKFPNSVQIRENTDQKNYVFGQFSRSDTKYINTRVTAFIFPNSVYLWEYTNQKRSRTVGYFTQCILSIFSSQDHHVKS